jgi:hypothetical protein
VRTIASTCKQLAASCRACDCSRRAHCWQPALDATQQGRTFCGMAHGKKKFSGSREASKKGPPLGLVITLAAIGGMVIGSAGTYFFSKPLVAPKQSSSPAGGGTPQAQFTPAPQPPGEAPPGKVWSVEHGHWHDAPVALTPPAPAPTTPATVTPTPEGPPAPPPTVAPTAPTRAPAATPVDKKE